MAVNEMPSIAMMNHIAQLLTVANKWNPNTTCVGCPFTGPFTCEHRIERNLQILEFWEKHYEILQTDTGKKQ